MARPAKTGLDYFPMDVGFLRDKKVRLLRAEFGASSVLFVLYVLSKVYEGDGYFLTWDKDEALIAADELRESPQYISEVLHGCLSRSLFDERVFQMFGVLTSAGIQRRYLRSCEKRDDIEIFSEYWLLNVDEKKDVPACIRAKLAFFEVSGGKNPVNSHGNPVNSPGNPESKVKESKVKESRVEAYASCAEPETAPAPTPVGDRTQPEESGFGPELAAAFSDWLQYKREKRQDYKPMGLRTLTDKVRKYAEAYGEHTVAELIRDSMSSNYQGILWDRLGKGTGGEIGPTPGDNGWMKAYIQERKEGGDP